MGNVEKFKHHWRMNYPHISLELDDFEIQEFIDRTPTIEKACDIASDYLLANNLSEVEE